MPTPPLPVYPLPPAGAPDAPTAAELAYWDTPAGELVRKLLEKCRVLPADPGIDECAGNIRGLTGPALDSPDGRALLGLLAYRRKVHLSLVWRQRSFHWLHDLCGRYLDQLDRHVDILRHTAVGQEVLRSGMDRTDDFEAFFKVVRAIAGIRTLPKRPEKLTGLSLLEIKVAVERLMNWCADIVALSPPPPNDALMDNGARQTEGGTVISEMDLPKIRATIEELYRVLEDPTPTNPSAARAYRDDTRNSTLGEQNPEGVKPAGLISSAIQLALMAICDHTRMDCPEIANSRIDLSVQGALIQFREYMTAPLLSSRLENATNRVGGHSLSEVFLTESLVPQRPRPMIPWSPEHDRAKGRSRGTTDRKAYRKPKPTCSSLTI